MPAARIQPQGRVRLNAANKLAKNALAVITASADVNVVTGKRLARVGSGFQKKATPSGIVNAFRENYYLQTELLPAIGTAPFVEVWIGYPDAVYGTRGAHANSHKFLTGSSTNQIGICQNSNLSAEWGMINNWSGTITAGEVVPIDSLQVLVAVRRANTMDLWRNGRMMASGAIAPFNQQPATMIIGAFIEDISYWSTSSDTLLAGRFLAEWSAEDVKSFSANPWQLLEGQAPMLYAASAPSAYSLTGPLTAQPNTSGSGVAGQVHALSGAATAQANTAASASVAQAHALAGASAAQPNAASSGALSQVHMPAGAAATQPNASSSGAAGQAHQLTGSAATQANTAASGALSSTLALAGSSVTQSNASGAGAMGQVHALTGAQAAQANGSTSAAVGVNGALTGANVVQANTTGSGAATQAHALSGASAVQGNAATSGALTGGSVLAGAAAAQGNTASSGAITQVHTLGGAACGQANVAAGGRVALFHLLTAAASNQINLSPGGAAADLPPVAYARAPAGPGYSRPFTNTTRPQQVNTRRTR